MSTTTNSPESTEQPKPAEQPESVEPEAPPEGSRSAGYQALVMPGILLATAIYLIYGLVTMDVVNNEELLGPRAMPTGAAILLIVLAVIYTIDVLRNPTAQHAGESAYPTSINFRSLGIAIGSLVAFAALLQPLGWLIAAAVLFFGMTTALGWGGPIARKPLFNALLALAFAAMIQLVFGGILGLTLPAGIFFGG